MGIVTLLSIMLGFSVLLNIYHGVLLHWTREDSAKMLAEYEEDRQKNAVRLSELSNQHYHAMVKVDFLQAQINFIIKNSRYDGPGSEKKTGDS